MCKKISLSMLLVLLLCFFYGCPKKDVDDNGGDEQLIAEPSFARDIQAIFTANCSALGCHGNGSSSEGLSLEAGKSYLSLVNVPAAQEPGKMRVEPSNAANSYLVIKIEGLQTKGGRMPQGGSLSGVKIGNIKNWINNGAPNN